jgi:rhomboid protease GluP
MMNIRNNARDVVVFLYFSGSVLHLRLTLLTMAFGFTPKFEQTLDLNGLDPKKYLAIALDTVNSLSWDLGYTSRSGLIAYIGKGILSTSQEFKITINEDQVFIVSSTLSNEMYDWGKNKRHVRDFVQTFESIHSETSDEELERKVAALKEIFESEEEDLLAAPPATAKDNLMTFFSFFTPRPGYFFTPLIIDLTILIFAIMAITGISVISPTGSEMVSWGANFRPLTLEGQFWRLITNVFLHFGIFHLLFNMYALLYVGLLLEPYLGKTRFIMAYFFTGVIASLTSIYWHPLTISAGASGAIFGMYGVFLAMLTTNLIDRALRKPLLTSIGVFVFFNLANGLKDGIDNAAHIGGLISGLLIGYGYYPALKNPERINIKNITFATTTLIFLAVSIGIYNQIPDDVVRYNSKMESFADEETKALALFSLPDNMPKDQLIASVDSGILHWEKSLKFVNEADNLDIPEELKSRLIYIKRYCELRIKSYGFIKRSLIEDKTQYADSIKIYDSKLEAALKDIKGPE